jgi:opacity protein-like surface antigen
MNGFRHLMLRMASDRMRGLALCLALSICVFGHADPVLAQVGQPPLDPPGDRALASGPISIGQWFLTPSLDVSTLYNSNIQSSTTNRQAGAGFHYHPALQGEFDTGIYDTKLYGSFDSTIYPTHTPLNTFNPQAGAIETYAPLRDLIFTTQVDYNHQTNAAVVVNSIPSPIITSPANPAPQGATGVVTIQQTTVNPNDNYTATASVYKEFNRAFLKLGSSIALTQYEQSTSATSPNYYKEIYNGSGGFWFTPFLYAFADAVDANTIPAVGLVSNSYLARGGVGSDQIGLFQGSVYYGNQGTAVDQGGGVASGNVYGGTISYFPSSAWTMSVSVDRIRNRSDISGLTPGASGLPGLPGLSISLGSVTTASSTQVSTITYRSNYTFSEQISGFVVASDSRISFLDMPRVDNSWAASAGLLYNPRNNLSLTATYAYTRYISEQPLTSFNQSLVTLGAHYNF